jgi:hypothetical protein
MKVLRRNQTSKFKQLYLLILKKKSVSPSEAFAKLKSVDIYLELIIRCFDGFNKTDTDLFKIPPLIESVKHQLETGLNQQ